MAGLFGVLGYVIVLVALFEGSSAQTTHTVLDSRGWIIPIPGGAGVYTTWAANKTFMVGDTLFFNFTSGQHDVVQVTRADFDACAFANPIGPIMLTGPASVTLIATGEHYYICTVGPHCTMGQKLAINVVTGPSSAPTPSAPLQSSGPTAAGPTTNTAGSPPPSLPPTTSTTPPQSSGPTAGGPTIGSSPPPSLAPTSSSTPPQSPGPAAAGPTIGSPPPPSTPTDGPTTSTTPPQTTGPSAPGPTTNATPSPPTSASVAATASRFVAVGSVILVAINLIV